MTLRMKTKKERLKADALQTMATLKVTLRSIVLTLPPEDVGEKIIQITNAFGVLEETIEGL